MKQAFVIHGYLRWLTRQQNQREQESPVHRLRNGQTSGLYCTDIVNKGIERDSNVLFTSSVFIPL